MLHVCRRPWRPERVELEFLELGLQGCELLKVSARNSTQAHWKSKKHSLDLWAISPTSSIVILLFKIFIYLSINIDLFIYLLSWGEHYYVQCSCSAIVWVLGIEVRLLDWHLVPLPAEPCSQPPNTESCSVVECGKMLKRMSYMSSIFSSWQGGGQCRLLVSFCVVGRGKCPRGSVQTAGTRARLRTVLSCLRQHTFSTTFQWRIWKGEAVIPWCSGTAVTV